MSTPTLEPTYITDTMPPKDDTAASPTMQPTYLTFAPTDIKGDINKAPNTPGLEFVTQQDEKNPTLEPTYLTDAPTDAKADAEAEAKADAKSPTLEPTYLTDAPTDVKADAKSPTIEPTYLTDAPTDVKADAKSPTIEPTYVTFAPTSSPSTGFPTHAPTITHAPTYLTNTNAPIGADATPTIEPTYVTYDPTDRPTVEDSVEDSISATGADGRPTGKPTIAPTGTPTKNPTPEPTQKPTNPGATIKEDKFRNQFVGFQSNWGPAHPGSMTYDFTRNSIYVSGTSFAPVKDKANKVDFQRSTCFVGEMPIADIEKWKADDIPKPLRANKDFVVPDSFDEKEIMGCHAIYYDDESKADDVLYVGTVTEPDATIRDGNIHAGLNLYERTRSNPQWELKKNPFEINNPTVPDRTPDASPVRWPVAMTSGMNGNDNKIAVLTVSSNDPLLTEEYIENGDANNKKNSKNSLMPPGLGGADPLKYNVPKRGTGFYMSYHRYGAQGPNGLAFESGDDYVMRASGDIFPSGILNLTPTGMNFVFSGSMKGQPPGQFAMANPVNANGEPRVDDFDGFVTGIDSNNRFNRDRNIRFDSIEANPPLDDYAHGICAPPAAADGNVKSYYVVGSSWGTMPNGNDQEEITTNILSGLNELEDGNQVNRLSAWVSKIDLRRKNERSIVWTTQLFASIDNISLEGGMAEAFGCHVIDQEKSKLYIAGNVYNGGTMDSAQKSGGGDDVWVAQLNSDDGSLNWIRQIGSSGDEKLARTNGIESDLNGHAIIYGETTGELYRRRRGEKTKTTDGTSTDIFVTTLDKNSGSTESTIESDRSSTAKKDAAIGAGVTALLVCLCIFCGFIMKWRRAKRYATKGADGILNTRNFKEGDGSDTVNLASGEGGKKTFKDTASDEGDEANGDASGGLSKFV